MTQRRNNSFNQCPGNPGALEVRYQMEYPTNYVRGLDGKSAYDYAKEKGYTGTEEEFAEAMAKTGQVLIATTDSLGNVIIGWGLKVTEEGIVSVDFSQVDLSQVQLGQEITVTGIGELGGYKDGDIIPADSTLFSIVDKLLRKELPVEYLEPVLDFSVNPVEQIYEVGQRINPVIKADFIQNDAGELTNMTVTVDGSVLAKGSSDIEIIDEARLIKGDPITYIATAQYLQGPVKESNFGNPQPEGQIPAGMISASAQLIAQRCSFSGSSKYVLAFNTSEQIRNLQEKNFISVKTFNCPIIQGARTICIAYPAELGPVSSIVQKSLGYDVKGAFTLSNVLVAGEGGFAPIYYNVYRYEAMIELDEDTYIVTL